MSIHLNLAHIARKNIKEKKLKQTNASAPLIQFDLQRYFPMMLWDITNLLSASSKSDIGYAMLAFISCPSCSFRHTIVARWSNYLFNPFTSTVAIWLINHPVPDRVKPPFAIFDIRALWLQDAKNYKWRLNPVWHRNHQDVLQLYQYGNSGRQRVKKLLTHSLTHSLIWPRPLIDRVLMTSHCFV